MDPTPASAELAVSDGVPQPPARPRRTRSQARRRRAALCELPPRGPARRRHDATRRDVARRGLPGPAGMDEGLLDHVLTARAVPDAEWIWDEGRGAWRVVTDADDAPWTSGDVSGLCEHPDDLGPYLLSETDGAVRGPSPYERNEEQRRARRQFERWLAEDADDDERRRVCAVVAERAATHAAGVHAHRLRAHQAAVGRAQGSQVRILAAMAPLYRAAVHHPDSEPDGPEPDGDRTRRTSRAQRQREALEASGLNDLVSEVALLLAWTEHRAGKQVRLAEHVVSCLPRTLERLEAGRLDLALVTVVAEQSLDLDPQLALELDEEVFGPDGSGLGLNTAELKDVVDEVVARKDAAAVRRRSRRKVSARSVVMRPLGDGIAQLVMTGPAPAVLATYEHLDTVAGLNLAEARQAISEGRPPADGGDPYASGVDGLGAPDGPEADAAVHDARRMPAHRFDALATAVQGASPAEPGAARPQTTLEMHAMLSTLCGQDDQPGWLEGYGWVPGWLVRQGLTWDRCRLRRILTDPFTGDLVTVDGHTYPASWLTDPGPPPAPPSTPPRSEPPGTPPAGPDTGPSTGPEPSSGGSAAADTFHGRPVQRVQKTSVEEPDQGPSEEDLGGTAPASADTPFADARPRDPGRADAHHLFDDLLLAPEADSPAPCTDGTCSPASPSDCPVASVGGGRYTPPAAQARVVRRRWGRCAHPGCRRRAMRCDLDHVVPHRRGGPAAGGGTTCACNLEPKCRRHHLLKHGTDTSRLTGGASSGVGDPTDLDDGWVRWTARWQQWRCDRGSSHWRSPLGFDRHSAPRPAALPDERYRLTPWPPRNPVEEERVGRRHQQPVELASPSEETRCVRSSFPDEPPF